MIAEGGNWDDFVRFWRLVAEAVKGHSSAFAIEPMNEPMSIKGEISSIDCALSRMQ